MSKASKEELLLIVSVLAIISIFCQSMFPTHLATAEINNNTKTNESQYNLLEKPIIINENAILSQNDHETKITTAPSIDIKSGPLTFVPQKRMVVMATAYSSTVDQCDSTPFITASGAHVYDGAIAANFLKFGTKVRFPSLYEDKIFIVEDRMKSDRKVDIWFPTRQEAKNFGVKRIEMEIL